MSRQTRSKHSEHDDLAVLVVNDPQTGFVIRPSPGKGLGTFATENIPAGKPLYIYGGDIISKQEGERREKSSESVFRYFFMFKGKQLCSDATTPSKFILGRMTNHGVKRQQNAKMKVIDFHGPQLMMYSIRTLKAGEEVLYDYGVNDLPWLQRKSGEAIPLNVSFPEDISVTVPFGTPNTTVTWAEPTTNDTLGTVILSKTIESGSSFPTGQTTAVTYTFTRPTGNSFTRTFQVTVVELTDRTDPFVTSFPEDISVTVPFGTPNTTVTWAEPTTNDNLGTVISSKTIESGSPFPTGQTTAVTYTFTNSTGNSVKKTFQVTVVELTDTVLPQVTAFPEDVSVTIPFGKSDVSVVWPNPTVSNNSGPVIINSDRQPGSFFSPGTTPVTYLFTDLSGNSVTRTLNVKVNVLDNSFPTADRTDPFVTSFPEDISVTVPFGTPNTTVTWAEPTTNDNLGTVISSKTIESGSPFPTGQTTAVTYTFTNSTGNSVKKTFQVTVVELTDTVLPQVTAFPEDVSVTIPFGKSDVSVVWPNPTVSNNSGPVIINSDRQPGSFFSPGTTPVTYLFTDLSGNSVTRTLNVKVNVLADRTDPFVTSFPEDISVTVPFGTPNTTVTWAEPTTNDNLGTVISSKTIESGSPFPTGQTTAVTYTFTNSTGNSVKKTFQVTVVELTDTVLPQVTAFPEDVSVTIPFGKSDVSVVWPNPTVSNNSGPVIINSDRQPGSFFSPGTTPVTYLFTDLSGNSVTRTLNVKVNVLDNSFPTADRTDPFVTSFPEDISVTVPFGTPNTTVTWAEPTTNDNLGTVISSKTIESGSPFPTGQTTAVTYTFTNSTGKSVTKTFQVTVVELSCSSRVKRLTELSL
ncbi:hyalin-like [Asterias rubens]|uniref:hyalin-like n=1 Tax=Asterias rubens TaxID=7604 RepID=UPI001454E9C7|nr:hyalin-like [Asterias rubens]